METQVSTRGSEGGSDLVEQEHWVSALLITPELEHLAGSDMSAKVGTEGVSCILLGVQDPRAGKSGGEVPRSMQPASDK